MIETVRAWFFLFDHEDRGAELHHTRVRGQFASIRTAFFWFVWDAGKGSLWREKACLLIWVTSQLDRLAWMLHSWTPFFFFEIEIRLILVLVWYFLLELYPHKDYTAFHDFADVVVLALWLEEDLILRQQSRQPECWVLTFPKRVAPILGSDHLESPSVLCVFLLATYLSRTQT